MSGKLERNAVLERLSALDAEDPGRKVFGAQAHQYRLNPPLAVTTLDEFEARHSIQLPLDYRLFLTEIGNGGAGPYYGVFPFGMQDDGFQLCPWENGGLLGDVSKPFPHREAWNLPETFWQQRPAPGPEVSPEGEDRMMEEWDEKLGGRTRSVPGGAPQPDHCVPASPRLWCARLSLASLVG